MELCEDFTDRAIRNRSIVRRYDALRLAENDGLMVSDSIQQSGHLLGREGFFVRGFKYRFHYTQRKTT